MWLVPTICASPVDGPKMLPPTRAAIRRLAPMLLQLFATAPALRAPSASRVLATVAASSAAAPWREHRPCGSCSPAHGDCCSATRYLRYSGTHLSCWLARLPRPRHIQPAATLGRLWQRELDLLLLPSRRQAALAAVGWNLTFMAINCGHIYRIQSEHWQAQGSRRRPSTCGGPSSSTRV